MILQSPPPSKAPAPLQEDKRKILASIKEDLCLKYSNPLSCSSNTSHSKQRPGKFPFTGGTQSLYNWRPRPRPSLWRGCQRGWLASECVVLKVQFPHALASHMTIYSIRGCEWLLLAPWWAIQQQCKDNITYYPHPAFLNSWLLKTIDCPLE